MTTAAQIEKFARYAVTRLGVDPDGDTNIIVGFDDTSVPGDNIVQYAPGKEWESEKDISEKQLDNFDALRNALGSIVGRLVTASTASQTPAGLTMPLQVNFGAGGSTGAIDVNGAGTITANDDVTIALGVSLNVGRSNSTGIAQLLVRPVLNGSPVTEAQLIKINTDDNTDVYKFSDVFNMESGDSFYIEIMRDSGGADDGGLVSQSSDWGSTASAVLSVVELS